MFVLSLSWQNDPLFVVQNGRVQTKRPCTKKPAVLKKAVSAPIRKGLQCLQDEVVHLLRQSVLLILVRLTVLEYLGHPGAQRHAVDLAQLNRDPH